MAGPQPVAGGWACASNLAVLDLIKVGEVVDAQAGDATIADTSASISPLPPTR